MLFLPACAEALPLAHSRATPHKITIAYGAAFLTTPPPGPLWAALFKAISRPGIESSARHPHRRCPGSHQGRPYP